MIAISNNKCLETIRTILCTKTISSKWRTRICSMTIYPMIFSNIGHMITMISNMAVRWIILISNHWIIDTIIKIIFRSTTTKSYKILSPSDNRTTKSSKKIVALATLFTDAGMALLIIIITIMKMNKYLIAEGIMIKLMIPKENNKLVIIIQTSTTNNSLKRSLLQKQVES